MKRVLCINDDFSNKSPDKLEQALYLPQESKIYDVTECDLFLEPSYIVLNKYCGMLKDGRPITFKQSRFIELQQEEITNKTSFQFILTNNN